MAEPQFKKGETCDLHTRLDCHECSHVMINRNPSTAHYEGSTYVPDPLNQPLCFADNSAHDRGQKEHPFPASHLNSK
jgi:hypothetical protein